MSGTKHVGTLPKIIFFTDFDGTITTTDSNDYLVSLTRILRAWLTIIGRKARLWRGTLGSIQPGRVGRKGSPEVLCLFAIE